MSSTEALDRWLEDATRGLSVSSGERVASEIRAHYDDALASGLEPGEALRGLGDAMAARRALRRVYLTSLEESLVRDYRGRTPVWRLLIYASLWLMAVGVVSWTALTPTQQIVGAALVAEMTVALLVATSFVGRLYRRGRERLAILLGALADFALYAGLIVGSRIVVGNLAVGHVVFFGGILLILLVLYLPLLHKLRDRPEHVVPRAS